MVKMDISSKSEKIALSPCGEGRDGVLLLIERVTLVWWLVTTVAVLVLWPWLSDPVGMMLTHALIALCVCAAWLVDKGIAYVLDKREKAQIINESANQEAKNSKTQKLKNSETQKLRALGLFVRVATQLAMLALWYGETYDFCSLLPYQDHVFAGLDQTLFGCQPSIVFGEALRGGLCGVPEGVFSELFNLGYYSYFWMQLVVMVYYFFCHRAEFDRVGALILTAFFSFYVVYMVLPVGGPQFYFQAIGIEQASAGVFPDMGHYLATHQDMLPAPGWQDGFFYNIIMSTQDTGEYPTAAFPSSHIGCTVVFLCLALRRSRTLFVCLLPFAILLACATVYIQAHYLVDALAGLLCGLLIYHLLKRVYF